MRTTLTLDPDVAEKIREQMKHRGAKMKTIINEALRRGLQLEQSEQEVFSVVPQDLGLKPGIDPFRLNQLVDELEAEAFARARKE